MNFSSRYHPKSFLPKIVLGKMLYALGDAPYGKGELLVLNFHSTPMWLMDEFEKQVQYLSHHFTLVSPGYISSFFERKENDREKPALLFTFDDGLRNNIHAARILEKYHARGLFFIVPAFLNASAETQKEYYTTHIRTLVNYHIDKEISDVTAMQHHEIKALLINGHSIGSHSYSHTMSSGDDSKKNENEIINSRIFLEDQFGVPVNAFCAPFDSLISTGREQMNLIKQHYQFFHSTFPGSNRDQQDPFFIRRVNIECWWPMDVLKFALSGFEWKRWKEKRERFRREVL